MSRHREQSQVVPTGELLPNGDESRFAFERCLGRGGFGEVWQARDRLRGGPVALKILHSKEPAAIREFKAEFRRLSDVSHPNLVSLYDFISDGENWAFTMELVRDARDFVSYVGATPGAGAGASDDETTVARSAGCHRNPAELRAGEPGSLPVELSATGRAQLRDALPQLVEGVYELHRRGIVHRDIKPPNVLVDGSGRVVLVDFGIAQDQNFDGSAPTDGCIIGTPRYMAPEQLRGQRSTPASDVYALGLMLHEALVGRPLFDGDVGRRLIMPAPSIDSLPVGSPAASLPALVERMLDPEPERRPTAADLLEFLGTARTSGPVIHVPSHESFSIVGRRVEMASLRAAHDEARRGSVLVQLTGPSGIGKSTLLHSFIDQALQRQPGCVAILGRCYERETIPFKALDVIVDQLMNTLSRSPQLGVELREHVDTLTLSRAFPVLGALPGFTGLDPVRRRTEGSAEQFSNRAIDELVILLRAIGKLRGLVVALDDVQWGDTDSATAIAELLRPDEPLLVVLASRGSEEIASPFVRTIRERLAPKHIPEIRLPPLSPRDSAELAQSLLRDNPPSDDFSLRISDAAGGSPLLVTELARYAASRPDAWTSPPPGGAIDELFRDRVERLSEPSIRLLTAVAVAGRPIPESTALAAAAVTHEHYGELLALRNDSFLSPTRHGEQTQVTIVHDRLRDFLNSRLEPKQLVYWNRRLAEAIESADPLASEHLADHYRSAGLFEQARHHGLRAARNARNRYAFHDAASHYAKVLELREALSPDDSPTIDSVELALEYAAVLRQLGAYQRAIDLLHATSEGADEDQRKRIRATLGTLYEEKGESATATEELEAALAEAGMGTPSTGFGKVLGILTQWAGAMFPWMTPRLHRPGRAAGKVEDRVHLLNRLIRIYYFLDLEKMIWAGLASRSLVRLVQSPLRRAEGYSNYGVVLAGLGLFRAARRWCREGVEVARASGDVGALGTALSRLGTRDVFANDLEAAKLTLSEAVECFDTAGYEMWEFQTCLMLEAMSYFLSSDLRRALQNQERMGALARRLTSPRHEAWSLAWAPYCRYLMGTQTARDIEPELETAFEISAGVHDLANMVAAKMHLASVATRERDVTRSAMLAFETHNLIADYRVPVPFLQIAWLDAAEAALFVLEVEPRHPDEPGLRRLIRRSLVRGGLLGRAYPYLRGPTLRVRARWLALQSRRRAAERVFGSALEVLNESPNRWETAKVYVDWARCVPERREDMRRRAAAILIHLGAHGELARLDDS
jgi:tetratricopeptide (TPR) repeat protein